MPCAGLMAAQAAENDAWQACLSLDLTEIRWPGILLLYQKGASRDLDDWSVANKSDKQFNDQKVSWND